MNKDSRFARFEELDAGRALGDLDSAELAEWTALAEELGLGPDHGLDGFAAELEVALGGSAEALPTDVAARLKAALPAAAKIVPSGIPEPPRRKVTFLPWLGWAAAACLLGLLVLRDSATGPAPADRRDALVKEAADLRRIAFAGTGGSYASVSGEVLWSDARQEGYMVLSNLPANDPAKKQYQLWIVDPARDEIPVDGGVFDIPAGGGPVVIPVDAKLAVKNPAAFVITLEQPGGVVRSKQEVVAAVAKS
jgi:hypothetical protein